MTEKASLSPAMALLDYVWKHRSRAIRQSTPQTGGVMSNALDLAIQAGLLFAKEDFAWLGANMTPSYYDTSPFGFRSFACLASHGGEPLYTQACRAGHTSACQSFEHWKGRTPFFINGHRLRVGSELTWERQQVIVTSFNDEKGTLLACAYEKIQHYLYADVEHSRGEGRPTKRYTLTHADLKAAFPTKQKEKATTDSDAA